MTCIPNFKPRKSIASLGLLHCLAGNQTNLTLNNTAPLALGCSRLETETVRVRSMRVARVGGVGRGLSRYLPRSFHFA